MRRLRLDRTARRHALTVAGEIIANVVLPYVIYVRLAPVHGDVSALMAAAIAPILWSVAAFLRHRRVDAISMVVLIGIALSLFAFIGSGSARFLQLRENLVSGLIGIAFLASAALGRPLIYRFALAGARRVSAEEAAVVEALRDVPGFHRGMMLMTLIWGIGLLGQMTALCAMIFALPIGTYLLVSPFVGYGMMGVLALWSVLYTRTLRRGAGPAGAAAPY